MHHLRTQNQRDNLKSNVNKNAKLEPYNLQFVVWIVWTLTFIMLNHKNWLIFKIF